VEVEGGVHHVYARGNDGCAVFRDDVDRERYLALIDATVRLTRWRCLTYCLMTNHVHLLVETPEPNLGKGMHGLHSEYARRFNKRYDRTGHLFGDRFGSVHVRDDTQLWTVMAYIAVNPVDAGMCARPEDWLWSSHRSILDGSIPRWLAVDRLLELLGGWGGNPRDAYVRHVADRLASRQPGPTDR
jgi:putative transposase